MDAKRSKIDDPPETVRPTIGTGVPGGGGGGPVPSGGGATVLSRIDPAKYVGAGVVRQMARETCLVLLREQARTLCRVMGLAYDDMALVLRLACVEFTDLAHSQTVPPG